MCGLNNKCLYTIVLRTFKCLVNIVYHFSVTIFNMVDNDICSKTAAYRKIGNSLFNSIFNCADRKTAAVVETCTEAEHKKFFFAYLILIAGVIQRRIARGIILFILFALCGFSFRFGSSLLNSGCVAFCGFACCLCAASAGCHSHHHGK